MQSKWCVCLWAATSLLFAGADWRQFRGNENQSAAEGPALPTTWSDEKNVAWKADVPGRSTSSPIVVAGRVIVTSCTGARQDRLHVLCFDAATGKPRWQRQFWATGRTLCHPVSSVAAPTPASDGRRVFAFFSSNDLVCLDLDGNLLWLRGLTHDYPTAANDVGLASSPLVVGDTLVVQVENEGDSFAAGLDAASGEERWRIPRGRKMNWCSPTLFRGEKPEQDAVLLQSPAGLTAHEPKSGKVLWTWNTPCKNIASPVAAAGRVYVPSEDGLAVLYPKPGSEAPDVVWKQNKLSPGSTCPIVHEGRVYILNRTGVLACGNAETGDVLWQERVKGGTYWATPVLASGHLYCVNNDGAATVLKLGEKPEVAGTNDFKAKVFGTPAVADGALYVLTEKQLVKIAAP